MKIENLFDVPLGKMANEIVEEIFSTKNFFVERIISDGQSSPQNFWYDQNTNELVFLLSGSAEIEFENEVVKLKPGDYLLIPAHTKHRVGKTDVNQKSIWLTFHYNE